MVQLTIRNRNRLKSNSHGNAMRRDARPNNSTFGMKSQTKVLTPPHLLSIWNTKKVRKRIALNLIFVIYAADGTNIDNWTYEEIKEVVADFVSDALKTN